MDAHVKPISALKRSKQVHSNWYRQQYPDVAQLGMDPAEHYLKYGAAMGRNPGKNFDTRFYLQTYPDVAEAGMNPLLHYALLGEQKGYARRPADADASRAARARIEAIRTKLLSLGFTDQPLAELDEIMRRSDDPSARAMAARELALWHMRQKTDADYRIALTHIATARKTAPDMDFRSRLTVAELLCHHFLGQTEQGHAAYDRAALSGEVTPDVTLAWTNFQTTPGLRLVCINQVLRHYDIPPVRLLDDPDLPLYDRLTAAQPLPAVADGPKVTVLIAAYEAAGMLPTALRSLQEQTWKNLEIIVIDDCSPSPGTAEVTQRFAARDPRIRLIRMQQNGGAYVARNRGLDEATGEFVTIHDADDWSHPLKIETQVRFMEQHPEVMGCTSEQARCRGDLSFTRWTGRGSFLILNVSSFLWRRAPVREALGYWDTVRFAADSEFIRRIEKIFGHNSVRRLVTGPLSFQRDSDSSAIADEFLGMNGFYFGARKEYFDAQRFHHKNAQSLKYDNDPDARPFPAPAMMRSDRKNALKDRRFDVIFAGDFREGAPMVEETVAEIRKLKADGRKIGIVEVPDYTSPNEEGSNRLSDDLRAEVDGEAVSVPAYGEDISSTVLIFPDASVLQHRQRYIPNVDAKQIKVIVNQPPMSDYTAEGVVRYRLADCAENIGHYFGKNATWHPISPMVRDALHTQHADELHHIDLSSDDWHNIIDIKGWDRGPRRRELSYQFGIVRQDEAPLSIEEKEIAAAIQHTPRTLEQDSPSSTTETPNREMPAAPANGPKKRSHVKPLQVLGLIRFSLLTRNAGQFWELARASGKTNLENDLFADIRLDRRFSLFESVVLPSLDKQTAGDFKVVLMTSDRMPSKYLSRLEAIAESRSYLHVQKFGAECTVPEAAVTAVSEVALRNTPLVTFRLDDDDALSHDFIQRISETALDSPDREFLTCPRGIYVMAKQKEFRVGKALYPMIGIGLARFTLQWDGKTIFSAGNHFRIRKNDVHSIDDGRPYWIRSVYGDSDSQIARDAFAKHVKKEDVRKLGVTEMQDLLKDRFPGISAQRLHAALSSDD